MRKRSNYFRTVQYYDLTKITIKASCRAYSLSREDRHVQVPPPYGRQRDASHIRQALGAKILGKRSHETLCTSDRLKLSFKCRNTFTTPTPKEKQSAPPRILVSTAASPYSPPNEGSG